MMSGINDFPVNDDPSESYFVYVEEPTTISLTGTLRQETTLDLNAGFNLFALHREMTGAELFAQVGDACRFVYDWTGSGYTILTDTINTNREVSNGWMYCDQAAVVNLS